MAEAKTDVHGSSGAKKRAGALNLAKARAAKRAKQKAEGGGKLKEERKVAERIEKKVASITQDIDAQVQKEVEKRLSQISDRKFLKEQFLQVFNKLGGADGMYKWAKKNDANLKEYYKMFMGMLKADTEADKDKDKGGVVVNFMMAGQGKSAIDVTPVKKDAENRQVLDVEIFGGKDDPFKVEDLLL